LPVNAEKHVHLEATFHPLSKEIRQANANFAGVWAIRTIPDWIAVNQHFQKK
jgi:hypothetical protein